MFLFKSCLKNFLSFLIILKQVLYFFKKSLELFEMLNLYPKYSKLSEPSVIKIAKRLSLFVLKYFLIFFNFSNLLIYLSWKNK